MATRLIAWSDEDRLDALSSTRVNGKCTLRVGHAKGYVSVPLRFVEVINRLQN